MSQQDKSVSAGTETAEVVAVAAADAKHLDAAAGPSYEEGPHLADPATRAAYRQHLLDHGVTADDDGLTAEMAAILNEPAD